MKLHGHQVVQRSYTGERELIRVISRSRCRRQSRHRRRAAQPLGLMVVVVAPRSTIADTDERDVRRPPAQAIATIVALPVAVLRGERECPLRATYWPSNNLRRVHTFALNRRRRRATVTSSAAVISLDGQARYSETERPCHEHARRRS